MKHQSRLIHTNISDDKGFAALSPKAQVLFLMILPHLNSFGKMNGGVGTIKDVVCPRISTISNKNIPKLMREITEHTSIKWFESEGRWWIHAISFSKYQTGLRKDRMGIDVIPNYSGSSPGVVRDNSGSSPGEVRAELEVEVEEEVEVEGEPATPPPTLSKSEKDAMGGKLEKIKAAWNVMAAKHGLEEILEITGKRRDRLEYCLRRNQAVEWWLEVISAVPYKRRDDFKPTFRWLVSSFPENPTECLEARIVAMRQQAREENRQTFHQGERTDPEIAKQALAKILEQMEAGR